MYTRVFRSRSNFSRNTIKDEREGDGAERIDPRKQNKTRSPFFFYYNGWCNVTHAYTSTRVRRVASDHFRDRSTASSSSSSPILFPSVFFLFSFSNKREDKIGENFAYTFHTNRGTTSRYIIQDVVSQKLETTSQVFPKCFTFPIPFFPCLLSHSFLA